MVLGHEGCGAVKSAVDNVKLGLITQLLAKIQPAINAVKKTFKGDFSSKNYSAVKKVCHSNVSFNVKRIRQESKIIRELEKSKKIRIIGGIYNMETGKVNFMENI